MIRFIQLSLLSLLSLTMLGCSNLKDSEILKGNDTVIIMKLSSAEDSAFSLSQMRADADGYLYGVEHIGHKDSQGEYYIRRMDTSGAVHPYDYSDDYKSSFHEGAVLSKDLYGSLEPLGQRKYIYTTEPQQINYLGDVRVVKSQINDGYELEVTDDMAAAEAFLKANYPSLSNRYSLRKALVTEIKK